jgi:phage gpG-like protein
MSVTVILQSSIPKIAAGMEDQAGQAVRATAFGIQGRAQASMQGPKSGRVYTRSGGVHQASAPGEAPAVDTGNLINSLQVEVRAQTSAAVYTNVEYAPVLEYGGAKMEARPFLTPAARDEWELFIERMKRLAG